MSIQEWLDKRIAELERELSALKQLKDVVAKQQTGEKPGQPLEGTGFDALPWRPFKNGSGEWIFRDEAPPELVKAMELGGGKAVIEGNLYTETVGKGNRRFIRRKRADK